MDELEVKVKEGQKGIPLIGESVLPVKYSKRSVTPNKLVAIWFAMAVEITIFYSSIELFESMPVWEIVLSSLFGHALLIIIMLFTQDIGIRYGIPFTVSLRSSFGYGGAILASYFRAVPAIFWFGFQTWVCASAMDSVIMLLTGYENLVLWIIVFGVVQIAHTSLGIKAVSRLSDIATPMLLVVGIYIVVLAFNNYDVNLSSIWTMKGSGEQNTSFMYAAISFMGGWATMAISIMDITKDCTTTAEESRSFGKVTKKFLPAEMLGFIPAVVLYTFIGCVGVATTGQGEPADILITLSSAGGGSKVMLIICLLFIIIATWSTNDTSNLFPAGYALSATFPRKINFAKGIILAGLIGLAVQPWNAANSIAEVMNVIGNLLAPVCGIMICDYIILRRRQLNVDALYDNTGEYRYWHNFNPAALIALVVSYLCGLPTGDASFFVSIFLSIALYYVLMKFWICKKYPQAEIK